MNLFSILTKEDYLMIKWQIAIAGVGLLLSIGIFLGIDYLSGNSLQDLRIAQADFNSARSRLELIEEEEETIIEYIGRYQMLDADGVVSNEDRLQMFERVAEIRSANNLFPVNTNINRQLTMPINYPPEIRQPGEPIALRSSVIGIDLPLLHEDDLFRLLDGIINGPGLFQTSECSLRQLNRESTNFIVLSQHFDASCEILWYTFDLDPPPPDPFGF